MLSLNKSEKVLRMLKLRNLKLETCPYQVIELSTVAVHLRAVALS